MRHAISEEFGHDPERYLAYPEGPRRDYPEQTRLYDESFEKPFDQGAKGFH
uniref:Uncharacterized protein n=1 Tax=Candidatus Kentrum sp. SD TaxID=2126332 RepID=A0A451BJ21_9GAMM|nr:MAG: hypothetical protein BECKSD772F_GA0070984_102813 [Candidatus Kentron sp. SD]VFK43570.1 MAG: hypothetical protein BECKSD772E_GA0070983_102713 [Candidatus Kentron sp. SD]VFK78238.1 MAG: hypothetical protein BECKSD772D_GA0070982_10106 [Candidatus Kentron sp. SD]